MRVGLVDVDSHNFPNLCLMKISAYHKARGDIVEWHMPFERYDIVYVSRVFDDTYSKDYTGMIQADKIYFGGTGYGLDNKLLDEIEHMFPDYSLYPKYKYALGFLTRGCPNNCPFCIVTKKEGKDSCKVADLSEFWNGQPEIKLLDPNLLMCRDRLDLLNQLADSGTKIDFTQGLDARALSRDVCRILKRIRIKTMHFAFDLMKNEQRICEGLKLYRDNVGINPHDYFVYILTNFNTSHDEDMYRIRKVQELGYRPYVMVYNKPSAPQITKDLQRWSNSKVIYEITGGDFSKYKEAVHDDMQVSMFEE